LKKAREMDEGGYRRAYLDCYNVLPSISKPRDIEIGVVSGADPVETIGVAEIDDHDSDR
jgi:hypothetical protein